MHDISQHVHAELDPTRVCKGKGAVTLRATLVHIDDDESSSKEPPENSAKSELKSALNIYFTKQYGARLIVVYYYNGVYDTFLTADVGVKVLFLIRKDL